MFLGNLSFVIVSIVDQNIREEGNKEGDDGDNDDDRNEKCSKHKTSYQEKYKLLLIYHIFIYII